MMDDGRSEQWRGRWDSMEDEKRGFWEGGGVEQNYSNCKPFFAVIFSILGQNCRKS